MPGCLLFPQIHTPPKIQPVSYLPQNMQKYILSPAVVVLGPYLVRSASIQHDILSLTGDWLNSTTLEVFAPSSVRNVDFNGASLRVSKTPYGSFVNQLQGSRYSVSSVEATLPALTNWKVNDGLPERNASYDDSRWVVANHMTTPNPSPPGTYPVLYSDEYGIPDIRVESYYPYSNTVQDITPAIFSGEADSAAPT